MAGRAPVRKNCIIRPSHCAHHGDPRRTLYRAEFGRTLFVRAANAKITLARSVLAQDDILRRVDRAISAIADATEPSVVHIETRTDSSNESLYSPTYSTGAGWVFDQYGHIVTNAHVVQSATDVSIEFFDGELFLARSSELIHTPTSL